MNHFRCILVLVLIALTLGRFIPQVNACGPSYIEPIFVFKESPDLPFENFTNGNIGIVQPTFGRKTLVIAYRYLNGGSFGADEQTELTRALKNTRPEEDSGEAVKTWISARKKFLNEDEKLPEIYVERQYGGYDYFPNCARNAFEVATETLKDRVTSHGAESPGIREWLAAQDTVFKNCVSGSTLPEEVGPEKPLWLRKDRDYQIAAALLYSVRFDQARNRFEQIAADIQSPWQHTAEYLVPRTLVRQASLSQNDSRKRQLYEQAEVHLQTLVSRGGKFQGASQRMLSLVKYRLHPEERVRELARTLAVQNGIENLGQDLIDYVWLLDKFETRILKEVEERKTGRGEEKVESNAWFNKAAQEKYEAIQRGELIEVRIYLKKPDGSPDYGSHGVGFEFKSDVAESEIFQAFEIKLGRKITSEEAQEIRTAHKSALSHRDYMISPNRLLQLREYEGEYQTEKLSLSLLPDFLLLDDLSNWIFSVQTDDPAAYNHAFKKWRDTGSHAWLTAALLKAEPSSPGLERLLRAAENVDRGAPAFAGSLYHRVRLKVATGRKAEARALLDGIIASGLDQFPVSTRNLLSEQRMDLAEDLNVFLRTGLRMPVAFYDDGRLGKLGQFREEDWVWNPEYHKRSKEEFESRIEDHYRKLLPWNDRLVFDSKTTEILNTHFSLPALMDVARSAGVPEYLRRRIVLTIWTRAVLLKNQDVADRIMPDVLKMAPEMTRLFEPYQKAPTLRAKQQATLFILLKSPLLSPLIADGLPESFDAEEPSYYYESSWWCQPSQTEYDREGNQVARGVPVPGFLAADQLAAAKRDQAALIAIGDAKSFLGKRVLEWARSAPDDPRLPEALFITSRANDRYKYGCSGWEHDLKTKEEAENVLRKRYPSSPWTAKLDEYSN